VPLLGALKLLYSILSHLNALHGSIASPPNTTGSIDFPRVL
jgi:hypothetical protein